MTFRTIFAATAAAAVLVTGAPAGADEAADKAVKLRQGLMQGISAATNGLVAGVKGDEAYAAIMADLATMLAAAADYDITSTAFAMNTIGASELRTTVTAAVWDDQDGFQDGLRELAEKTAGLAALDGSITIDDLKPLFDTCKACHDDYREK